MDDGECSIYRVTLVVADLGWVDFDLDVQTSCPVAQPILPKFLSAQAELGIQWNEQNHSQPNPGPRPLESPCCVPRVCDRGTRKWMEG